MKRALWAEERNSVAMPLPVYYRDNFPGTQTSNLFLHSYTGRKTVFFKGVGLGVSIGQEGPALFAEAIILSWKGRG